MKGNGDNPVESRHQAIQARKKISDNFLSIPCLTFSFEEGIAYMGQPWASRKGERIYLKGDNGCGKSSYLRVLTQYLTDTLPDLSYSYVGHRLPTAPSLSLGRLWDRLQLLHNAPCSLPQDLKKDRKVYECSAGQERLFLLRALLSPVAQLWIIDEGWVNLDRASLEVVKEKVLQYCATGGVVIYTDHHEAIAMEPTQVIRWNPLESH